MVRTAASVSTSAEALPARRGIVSQMPPLTRPQIAKPSRHPRLVVHIRVQLKGVLLVLDADCQLMSRSTPFNNSGLGPRKILWDQKQSGSSSALASTLRALMQDPVPIPGNLTRQVSGSVCNVMRLLQSQFRKDRKSQ